MGITFIASSVLNEGYMRAPDGIQYHVKNLHYLKDDIVEGSIFCIDYWKTASFGEGNEAIEIAPKPNELGPTYGDKIIGRNIN